MKIVCDCGHEFEVAEGDIKSHRVLCGDATKIEDVEKVMNNEKMGLVFTDPPYGINIVSHENEVGITGGVNWLEKE